MSRHLLKSLCLAACLAGTVGFAAAQQTSITFLTNRGDVTLPITPPPGIGGAGAINNMTIGGTTPAAIAGTTATLGAIVGNDSSLGVTGQAATTSSGTGGAIAVVGGAGGSTSGSGGAVSLAAGAATAGVGANASVTASAGVGSTNGGGSVNLVPGAAAGAGVPGTVKVNGDSNLMCATYYFTGTPAATDQVFYVATRPLLVVSVSEVHSVAAGGASALQVTKDSTTAAPGAGTDLLTNNTNTGFDLAATANTVQVGALTATVATKTLAAGDRLAVDFAQAIQSSAGVVVTACMAPL